MPLTEGDILTLVEKAQAGDERAWSKLLKEFDGFLQNAVLRKTAITDDRAAAFSAALFGFRQAVTSYRQGKSTFVGWMTRYVYGRIQKYFNEIGRNGGHQELSDFHDDLADEFGSSLVSVDIILAIGRSIQLLQPDELKAIQMLLKVAADGANNDDHENCDVDFALSKISHASAKAQAILRLAESTMIPFPLDDRDVMRYRDAAFTAAGILTVQEDSHGKNDTEGQAKDYSKTCARCAQAQQRKFRRKSSCALLCQGVLPGLHGGEGKE